MAQKSSLKVGLAVGYGTGPELAVVFEQTLRFLASRFSVNVDILRSPRTFHTYFSMKPESTDPRLLQNETDKDVAEYEQFCRQLVAQGAKVMFKTAINAQSLYLIRQHQEAVKVELFIRGRDSLLLIRDQAQGFYSGSNEHDIERNSVSKRSEFSKDVTGRIIAWSIERARQLWGPEGIDSVVMIYKFHLFDGVMSAWAKQWSEQYGVKIHFVQPDTANRNLLAYGIKGRQLMIAGNEWADIMHVVLLNMFGRGAPETSCTENVYLNRGLEGLVEYQTTHGSADDIAGKGIVNPSATIRAAVKILVRHAGVLGLEERLDAVLHGLARRKATTKDQGGQLDTAAVVDLVLDAFKDGRPNGNNGPRTTAENGIPSDDGQWPHPPTYDSFSQNEKTAVLVMDFQNDFVTAKGIGARYRGDMARMSGPATNIPRVVSHARSQGHEVIFVRFLGDHKYQLKNWQERDLVQGKEPKCIEGSWGADLFESIQPLQGERVFDKKAHFDAFLCDGFEAHLVARGVAHLILLGVYLDVCVDSTARTAFQKGYYLTVATDCTATLHLEFEPYLAYMKRLYGARIMRHDELIAPALDNANGTVGSTPQIVP